MAIKKSWRTTKNENGNYELGWEEYPTFWDIILRRKGKIQIFELRGSTWYDKTTGKYAHKLVAEALDIHKLLWANAVDDYV